MANMQRSRQSVFLTMSRLRRLTNDDYNDNNSNSQIEPYVDRSLKWISISFCLAIICGASSIILEIYALVRDNIFNQQIRGQLSFDPDEDLSGFPEGSLSAYPASPLRKTHNMKKFLTFPVHVLSRWDFRDFVYLLTLIMLLVIVVLHCIAVCFLDGFRATSKLSLACHLGSGVIILLLGTCYIYHLERKVVPYIKAADGYSRFAHQYDKPLPNLATSSCLGLPVCYNSQYPPASTSLLTWIKLKREAISLEFIFRICAKHEKHRRESYSTDEEYQHSEVFELNSITLKRKEYEYDDLKNLGFCYDPTIKIVSAVLCILFSFFCLMACFIITFNNKVDGDPVEANQWGNESYFPYPAYAGQTVSTMKTMQWPMRLRSSDSRKYRMTPTLSDSDDNFASFFE